VLESLLDSRDFDLEMIHQLPPFWKTARHEKVIQRIVADNIKTPFQTAKEHKCVILYESQ
jgi:hypothetical protein